MYRNSLGQVLRPRSTSRLFLVALVLALATPLLGLAQESEEVDATQRRLEQLRDLIDQDEEKLSTARLRTKAGLQELDRYNREIALRRELVATYRKRQEETIGLRDSLQARLDLAEADLNQLRSEYGSRATHAYKYGRVHSIALILAAESINQMLVRVRYLGRFADQRRERLAAIRAATRLLQEEQQRIAEAHRNAEQLIAGALAEEAELQRLVDERKTAVNRLRRAESNLQSAIEERQTAVAELESRLSNLIAASRGGFVPTGPDLTVPFVENKGKLPWPAIGVVREPFGEYVNPELGTRTPNPGIFIATSPQAEVNAVFDGQVISVDIMPDFGTYVIVRHGSYHSVYGNFSLLYAQQGDMITGGQQLGRAGTDAEPKGEGIFFAIFKDGQPIDPRPWLGDP